MNKDVSISVEKGNTVLDKLLKNAMLYSRSLASVCLLSVSLFAGAVSAGHPLIVAGTGDSQLILRTLAGQFMQHHPQYRIEIPDSIGSGGGIRGLLENRFELARTARPLKAKEQDGSLVEHAFALSPIVFCTHPSVTGVTNLSRAQVIGIYSGAIANWDRAGGPSAPVYPVDREAGDSSRTILERNMDGFKAARSMAKIFYTTPETAEAIAGHRYTIGFLPLGLARSLGLNTLSIDGVPPVADNITCGQYPYFSVFYLVSHSEPSSLATAFIDFVFSPDAVDPLRRQGLIPIKKERHETVH